MFVEVRSLLIPVLSVVLARLVLNPGRLLLLFTRPLLFLSELTRLLVDEERKEDAEERLLLLCDEVFLTELREPEERYALLPPEPVVRPPA